MYLKQIQKQLTMKLNFLNSINSQFEEIPAMTRTGFWLRSRLLQGVVLAVSGINSICDTIEEFENSKNLGELTKRLY